MLSLSFTPDLITVILSTINFLNDSESQLSRLQQIQNSARTVVKSLHWLRITERIEYKLLSLTYKVLTTTQPPYLYNLISVQRPRSTRSSSVVTVAQPPTSSSLKVIISLLALEKPVSHFGTCSDGSVKRHLFCEQLQI